MSNYIKAGQFDNIYQVTVLYPCSYHCWTALWRLRFLYSMSAILSRLYYHIHVISYSLLPVVCFKLKCSKKKLLALFPEELF